MEHHRNGSGRVLSSDLLLGLLLSFVLFHAAVQVLAIGASLLAVPISRPVALGILAVSTILGWFTWRWQTQQTNSLSASDGVDDEPVSAGFGPRIIVLVAVVAYVVLLACSIAGHDFTVDGNAYHIPTIHAYLVHQRACWIEEPFHDVRYMNGYPKGAELFTAVLVQALHPVLLNTASLLFLPLGSLGVAYLARVMGASSSAALLAGATWVLLPANMGQAGTTYVDSSHGSCVVAYLAILSSLIGAGRTLPASQGPPRWMPAVALGSALGLVIGIKSSGIAVGALGLLGLTVSWAITRTGNQRVYWSRRILVLTCFFGVVVTMGAAVGGYWYLRNWVTTGSPLYPAGLVVAGHRVFPGPSVSECIAASANTPPELRGLPTWKMSLITWLQTGVRGYRWPRTIVGVDPRLGGLGYLWIAGCVPATLWLTVRSLAAKRSDRASILCLVAVVAAAFFLQPLRWWARYTLWIYAVGLPCFAVAVHYASHGAGRATRTQRLGVGAVRLWVACCCAILLTEGVWSLRYAVRQTFRSTGLQRRQLLKSPAETIVRAWHADWRNNYAPELKGTIIEDIWREQQPIACGPLRSARPGGRWKSEYLGLLSYPIGQRRVYGLPPEPDPLQILRLQRNEVRHVVWDDTIPAPETLCAASDRVERAPGLIVFTLGSDPNGRP